MTADLREAACVGVPSSTRYKAGCRCDGCRRAHTIDHKRWLMGQTGRLVDATGTRRRIQALAALGWTYLEIAEVCGATTRGWARETLDQPRVHSATAARVFDAYEQMSMTVPTGKYRTRGRLSAQRKGWPPPLAWDDIDDPSETPAAWTYQPASRADLLADLDERHEGVAVVLRELKLNRKTLEKWCARNGHSELFARLVSRDSSHWWTNQHRAGGVA